MDKKIVSWIKGYSGCDVKCHFKQFDKNETYTGFDYAFGFGLIDWFESVEYIKPVLKQLENLTGEEVKFINTHSDWSYYKTELVFHLRMFSNTINQFVLEYLYSKRYDVHNLIHKELAIEEKIYDDK